jgi:hypothetical protein
MIDDAKIKYKNFSGKGSDFNREGDRNFALIIPTQEMADELIERGWNVRIKPGLKPGDAPNMYLPVAVKFNDFGPNVYLVTDRKQRLLREDQVSMLDKIEILSVDMDIRPYDYNMRGNTGRKAYLKNMRVIQDVDRFASDCYEEEEDAYEGSEY